jgi:hypothetical protein
LLPLLHGLGDYSTNKSLEPALKMFSCNNNTMNQTQPLSIYTSECMQLWIFDSSLFDHEDTRQEFMSKVFKRQPSSMYKGVSELQLDSKITSDFGWRVTCDRGQ